jgi:hypothetical protein
MARYDLKVKVVYSYEVEADNADEAEKEGWMYENYSHHAEVYEIDISEQEEYESDEEEEEE